MVPTRDLRDISEDMAKRWRENLTERGLSEATARKRVSIVKQIFAKAVSENVIRENPFGDLVSSAKPNPERLFFVDSELTSQVMDAMPSTQWRTIFGLARWAGIRIPSELIPLKWTDINWERGTVLIHSPKTERYKGQETRLIPLFPELREILLEAFEEATDGAEYVLVDCKVNNTNLRTQFIRLINRTGIPAWPKIFQNLRSTRETELVDRFPIHVVCNWIGNSPKVASDHYLQLHKDYFDKATQNPTQHVAESSRNESLDRKGGLSKDKGLRANAIAREPLQSTVLGPEGLEPSTNGL